MTEPNEPQEQEFGELVEIQLAPCTVFTNAGRFVVPDVGAWYYTAGGVVATGHWDVDAGESGEQTLFIPFQSIGYVKYDYDALARWQEHNEGSSA